MRTAYDLLSWPGVLGLIAAVALVLGLVSALVLGSFARSRASARLGETGLIEKLTSFDATARRTLKGTLLVLGLAFALAALSRPQYGNGQKLIPATNISTWSWLSIIRRACTRATWCRAARHAPRPKSHA